MKYVLYRICKSQKSFERSFVYSFFAGTHLRSVSWDSARRLCRAMSSIRCHSSRNRRPDSRPVHCPERAWCMPPWRWHIPWGPSGVSSLQGTVGTKSTHTHTHSKKHSRENGKITQSFIAIRILFTVCCFVLIWKVFRAVVKFDYYAHTHTHTKTHAVCTAKKIEANLGL